MDVNDCMMAQKWSYSRCNAVVVRFDCDIRIECQCAFTGDHRFRFAHMLFVEQKLAIQITDIDGIQINLPRTRGREREQYCEILFTVSWQMAGTSGTSEFYLRFQCRKIRSSPDFSILRIRCHQHRQPISCFR